MMSASKCNDKMPYNTRKRGRETVPDGNAHAENKRRRATDSEQEQKDTTNE